MKAGLALASRLPCVLFHLDDPIFAFRVAFITGISIKKDTNKYYATF
jgi:hypothetical protein